MSTDEMAKRFINTDLFSEDWFLDLDNETKLFYIYALLNCDHAGILKSNIRAFNSLNGTNVSIDTVMEKINDSTQKMQKITDRVLYLVDFVAFQYGPVLNPANRAHKSVIDILTSHKIKFVSSFIGASEELESTSLGIKDKDKDKEKEKEKEIIFQKIENTEISNFQNFDLPTEKEAQEAFRSIMVSLGIDPSMMGGSEALGSNFFRHYESQGWRKGNGMQIYKWRALVSTWLASEKGRQAGKTTNQQTTRSWD